MFSLGQSQLEQIDRESLRILSELGVRIDDGALRELAVKHGARAGTAADRICMPPEMVRELVKQAPARARIADCRGIVSELGPGTGPTFWTGAALNFTRGDVTRPITGEDLGTLARVADSLDGLYAMVGTSVAEVTPKVRDVVGLRIMAGHTRKHLRPLLFNADNVKAMIDMAQVIAGGKTLEECPLLSFGYSCLSPLHWARITTDMWRHSSGHRIPLMLNGEPIAGATSPVTLAGSVALSNAEILAGVALTQLLEPGRPVIHNLGFAHVTDMRTGACLSGSAECALMAYAGGRLAAFYKLPSASWMCSESFVEDAQASMEKMLTGLTHAVGGTNVIWGMGQLESQKALSPVQMVIDNEIALAVRRFWDGFQVSDESLAHDTIREVVESGQDFLSHEHTLAHFREELSESHLLERHTRQKWEAEGARDITVRAAAKVDEICAKPPEDVLTHQQRRELLAIEEQVLKTVA